MVVRRGAAAAVCASTLAACAVISGASDLEIGVVAVPDAGSDTSADAGVDARDAAPADARDAAVADAGNLLRNITFENGGVTGASGVDRLAGTVSLDVATPIAGAASAHIEAAAAIKSSIGVDFPGAEGEIHGSALFRFDSNLGKSATLVKITLTTPLLTITVALDGTRRFVARVGADAIGASAMLNDGVVYRLGLHIKAGDPGASLVTFSLAENGKPDVMFASANKEKIEKVEAIDFGQIDTTDIFPSFDDLRFARVPLP